MGMTVPERMVEPAVGGAEGASVFDDAALVALYLERRPNLVRLFAAKLGSAAAAEDLVQDIYLKLSTLKLSSAVHSPLALLHQIGSNLMLDRLRQHRRGMVRDTAWSEIRRHAVGGEDVADEPAADDALAARQRLLAAAAAIEELPPRMRRAFILHRLEGLNQAATARDMGVSVKAVEKHISAAMKILSRRLGGNGRGAGR